MKRETKFGLEAGNIFCKLRVLVCKAGMFKNMDNIPIIFHMDGLTFSNIMQPSYISCRILPLYAKRGKYFFFSKRPKTLFLQEIMTSVKDDGLTSNEKINEHFSSTIFISLERPNISQICSIYKGGEVRRFIKIFSPILPSYF